MREEIKELKNNINIIIYNYKYNNDEHKSRTY
jgi:hypothetical protein